MSHKYQVRQLVLLARKGYSDGRSNAGGLFEVTRLMPSDRTGEAAYRIKEAGAGSAGGERAVLESEITPRSSIA